jgi:hypothetical protein
MKSGIKMQDGASATPAVDADKSRHQNPRCRVESVSVVLPSRIGATRPTASIRSESIDGDTVSKKAYFQQHVRPEDFA